MEEVFLEEESLRAHLFLSLSPVRFCTPTLSPRSLFFFSRRAGVVRWSLVFLVVCVCARTCARRSDDYTQSRARPFFLKSVFSLR